MWTEENIALKSIHVMPALLLEKLNKNSEAKDHFVTLERKLELWKNGNTIELLNKGESIQERLPTSERSKDTEKFMLSQCK